MLLGGGRLPRAFVLAQLAQEEIVKAELLLVVAFGLGGGVRFRWRSFWQAWRRHDQKTAGALAMRAFVPLRTALEAVASIDEGVTKLRDAISRIEAELEAAQPQVAEGTTLRELATYVDFRKGQPTRPTEAVDEARAHQWISLARTALSSARAADEFDLEHALSGPAFAAYLNQMFEVFPDMRVALEQL